MPRIKEPKTKEEVLELVRIFVETDQEALWAIVARYRQDPTLVTHKEIAQVRAFTKHIDNMHFVVIQPKKMRIRSRVWAPYKVDVRHYLEGCIKDGGGFKYENATILYCDQFARAEFEKITFEGTHLGLLYYSSIDSNLSQCAASGHITAMVDYVIKEWDQEANDIVSLRHEYLKVAAFFGLDIAISFLRHIEKGKKFLWGHRALKITCSVRILEFIEKEIFLNSPDSRPHACIIKFFGHQCDPDTRKARELLQLDDCASRVLRLLFDDLDPALLEHYRIIDDPLALFKFVLENKPSVLASESDEAILRDIFRRIDIVSFANIIPLSLLPDQWISTVYTTLSTRTDDDAMRIASEWRECMRKNGAYYDKRLHLIHGRLLTAWNYFQRISWHSYAMWKRVFETMSTGIKESKTLNEILQGIVEEYSHLKNPHLEGFIRMCKPLDVLHPETVVLTLPIPFYGSPALIFASPNPVAYLPPQEEEGPISWASIVLNSNHADMIAINERLSETLTFVSKKDKEQAIHFNRSLGFLLHAIKECVLTVDEITEIKRRITVCKTVGDPYQNARFLEAAFIYLPANLTLDEMASKQHEARLVGYDTHPSFYTLYLAAHHHGSVLDIPQDAKREVLNEHSLGTTILGLNVFWSANSKKRITAWHDPVTVAISAWMGPGYSADATRALLEMVQAGDVYAIGILARWLSLGYDDRKYRGDIIKFFTKDLFFRCWRLANQGSNAALYVACHITTCLDIVIGEPYKAIFYHTQSQAIMGVECIKKDFGSMLYWYQKSDNYWGYIRELIDLVLQDIQPDLPPSQRLTPPGRFEFSAIGSLSYVVYGQANNLNQNLMLGYNNLRNGSIDRAIPCLTPLSLLAFRPNVAYHIALQIKQAPMNDHRREQLEWALNLLDIIYFPHIFAQLDTAFNLEAAEELHQQIEIEVHRVAESGMPVSQHIRRRHMRINDWVSGAQLTFIDLFPASPLPEAEREVLNSMRTAAAAGHLFLTDTVFHFHSEAGIDLLNKLLSLSGEKKSVSREPGIDHCMVSEMPAVDHSSSESHTVIVSGGGAGVIPVMMRVPVAAGGGSGGGGGGEARAKTVTTRGEVGSSSLNAGATEDNSFFGFGGRNNQTLVSSATARAEIGDGVLSKKFGMRKSDE